MAVVVLDPEILRVVEESRAHPETHPQDLDPLTRRRQYRERALAILGEMEPMSERRDVQIELEGRTLDARLYVPFGDEGRGLVVYLHGGSFVVGDLDTHEGLCRRLAADTKMRFLALDYRLAPEHPFPAALDDVRDALRFVASHRDDFGEATARLIVLGDSAGANLATVACAQTRDEDLDVVAQVLIYPTLGPEVVTKSAHVYASGYVLNLEHLRYDYRQYLGDFTNHTDPRVTPLMSSDLVGVPPAIVVVAEHDPLRDEAIAYAGLLENFGVSVRLLEAKGMVHGFLRFGNLAPEALAIIDDLAEYLHALTDLGG
ncbi:MAG: alpha/beta hydrolase [Acidobacteriota bacterium]|nr:alpha/beta hydrolase [Acidobacteriota bacterium]MDE3043689.1 alpha/beta hydrolase [Acidobacteriota bacterium]MDE3222465.1 alpha/beta hydrolase [Acidobacteriota bacterium]